MAHRMAIKFRGDPETKQQINLGGLVRTGSSTKTEPAFAYGSQRDL